MGVPQLSTGAGDSGSFEEVFRRAKLRDQMFGESGEDLTIGRYRVIERIGAGAMGVVYLGIDDALERPVALKMLRREDEVARARMLREARALARLSHPNVVTVHEVGTREGQVYVAMEFIEGTTVRDWLEEGPSVEQILDVYCQAAKGLQAAHDAGIVHRDFKPENALVGSDGRVRVLDFGLARPTGTALARAVDNAEAPTDLTRPTLTRTGMFAGTPAYMAPEQFAGTSVDARTDQFAFCVALHEALHGVRPFQSDSLVELANKVLEGDSLTSTSRGVSPRIEAVIERGIATNPDERFSSMNAVVEALGAGNPNSGRTWTRWLAAGAGAMVVALGLVSTAIYFTADVQVGRGLDTYPGRASQSQGLNPVTGTCELGDVKASGVWNEDRRRAIGTKFQAADAEFAAPTWGSIAPRLDAYANDWARAYDSACSATLESQGKDSGSSYEQMLCLDRRLQEFDALNDALERLPETGLARSSTAVASLFPISDCEPGSALSFLAPDGPPSEEGQQMLRKLAQVRALRLTGDRSEALAVAQRLQAEANSAGLDSVEIEAQILGTAVNVEADSRSRIAALEAAAERASTSGQNSLMVLATVEMLEVLAQVDLLYHDGDLESASELAPRVRAWASRARSAVDQSAPRSNLSARLYEATAQDHRSRGAFGDARRDFERALDLRRTLGNEVAIAHTRYVLGWLASDVGEYSRAEDELRAAAALQASALAPSHPARAQTLMRLAVVHHQQQEPSLAVDRMREALSINEAAFSSDHVEVQRARQTLAMFEASLAPPAAASQ